MGTTTALPVGLRQSSKGGASWKKNPYFQGWGPDLTAESLAVAHRSKSGSPRCQRLRFALRKLLTGVLKTHVQELPGEVPLNLAVCCLGQQQYSSWTVRHIVGKTFFTILITSNIAMLLLIKLNFRYCLLIQYLLNNKKLILLIIVMIY